MVEPNMPDRAGRAQNTRVVLLRHDLPDGSSHFDWLLEPREGLPLIAFRVAHRLDLVTPAEFSAQRIPDHRREYLDYQGPVSGGRGTVSRVAQGLCRVLLDAPRAFELDQTWGSAWERFHARPLHAAFWQFVASPGPPL